MDKKIRFTQTFISKRRSSLEHPDVTSDDSSDDEYVPAIGDSADSSTEDSSIESENSTDDSNPIPTIGDNDEEDDWQDISDEQPHFEKFTASNNKI